MGDTSIEWTDITVNCILARGEGSKARKGGYQSGVGHYCEKISQGCKNCYSSAMQPRFGLPVFQEQRRGGVEVFFAPERMLAVLKRKRPGRVFWNDMTDIFGSWVPNEWIAAMFGIMAATPHLTHQVLTKRAKRMREWFAWAAQADLVGDGIHTCVTAAFGVPELNAFMTRNDSDVEDFERTEYGDLIDDAPAWPLSNVWLGVSCEDQATADERIPELLATPAAVRFVSAEPLLGPIDLGTWLRRDWALMHKWSRYNGEPVPCTFFGLGEHGCDNEPVVFCEEDHGSGTCLEGRCREHHGHHGKSLDWLIMGSESGPGARPMDIAWARSIVDQCKAAGVAVFTKQIATPGHPKGGDPQFWPAGEWPREFPRQEATT
jgi:protein gp37